MSNDTTRLAHYADPASPALPNPGMKIDLSRTALVVIDPQIDFLSPEGVSWDVFGKSIVEHDAVSYTHLTLPTIYSV